MRIIDPFYVITILAIFIGLPILFYMYSFFLYGSVKSTKYHLFPTT